MNALFLVLLMCMVGFVFCAYMLIRNQITYSHAMYWIGKIDSYQLNCSDNGKAIILDYSDMVEYDDYFWRLFTFSRDKMIKDEKFLGILKKC